MTNQITIERLRTGRIGIYCGPPKTGELQTDRIMVAYLDEGANEISYLSVADPRPTDVLAWRTYQAEIEAEGLDAATVRAIQAAGARMGTILG